ncbi:sugar-binding protein [Auraticoccus monumenti]|uniref:Right handed beta helix region n=1 Tax=Auraticoccus monumenti TaxID=675864 RepID=A0A1G6Y6Z7_9ACTN|nr:sugar-binding protein [Auraticoccus monumenti]SDD86264.1 Right handed beta helix region [Auraticoccus monumenti]
MPPTVRPALALATTAVLAVSGWGAAPAQAAADVSITAFGAVAGDGLDDLPAIRAAVAEAQRRGSDVRVPAGHFHHDGLVELAGVVLRGTGERSELTALSTELQAVALSGTGTGVRDVRLTTVPTTQRSSTDVSARVFVRPGTDGYEVRGVTIEGATSAGVIAFGDDGVIEDNHVSGTLADGIHITEGSTGIRIRDNVVRDTGDDQIAVVSYEKFGEWARDIEIVGNDVSGGHARGITVSGGEDVLVERNRISRTGGAGIFVASEGSYRTYPVRGLRVLRNQISHDSQDPALPEKGGIRLQATNTDPSIVDAHFERNVIRHSGDSGVLVVGSAVTEATFERNQVVRPAAYGIRVVSTVAGALSFRRNSVASSGLAPFSDASSADVVSDMPNDPAAADGGPGESYVADRFTPVVDGVAEDAWQASSPLQLSVEPNGTTGVARVAWDEQRVHVLVEMVDATPSSHAANEHSDSVEMWLDELNTRNGARTTGDSQLRVGRDGALSSVVQGLVGSTDVRRAVTETPSGYTVEVSVPWAELEPTAGTVVGFNASANDDSDDDGQRDTYLSWVDKNLPYWADTRVYGQLTLTD